MKFDAVTLKRYLSPHAYKDLDVFLEQLPVRAGQAVIIAGVAAWVMAGLSVTYVSMQIHKIMELRADILKAESLKPTVPIIAKIPIEGTEVEVFSKKLAELYPQITVLGAGSRLEIRAPTTDKYGAFREATGHAFNGGKGWRLGIENLCVGRECKAGGVVSGAFNVYRLRVDKPSG